MIIGIDGRPLMDGRYSGVGWYAHYLINNLTSHFTADDYRIFYNSSREVKVPAFAGDKITTHYYRIPNKVLSLATKFFGWPRIDDLLGGVDTLYLPNINFVACRPTTRLVVTIHDLSFIHFPYFFTIKMRLWHWLINVKKLACRADAVIADSEHTKRDIIDLFQVDPAKVTVVYPGVAEHYFNPVSDEIKLSVRKKYNLPDKFILYLGAIEPRKNLESLVEAYLQLENPDHDLVIGGGVGWKSQRILDLAARSERIKLIGYVAEEDKSALYQLATAFVYPSYYEGFGLPLVEAMASGCPVIAGHTSSQGEVVADAGLLVDPHNINSIKQAMTAILGDERLRDHYRAKGLIQARRFSWPRAAEQIHSLLTPKV